MRTRASAAGDISRSNRRAITTSTPQGGRSEDVTLTPRERQVPDATGDDDLARDEQGDRHVIPPLDFFPEDGNRERRDPQHHRVAPKCRRGRVLTASPLKNKTKASPRR